MILLLLGCAESTYSDGLIEDLTVMGAITEPYITVERKGIDPKQVINRLHIIMATNEDWVVPAEYDSRRYAVFEVSDKFKQKAEYFKPISIGQSRVKRRWISSR